MVDCLRLPACVPPWSGWCTCDGWKAWILTEEGARDPNCRCSARGRPRPDFLITSVTWCICELHEAETRETFADETSETREAKDLTIATKDQTT